MSAKRTFPRLPIAKASADRTSAGTQTDVVDRVTQDSISDGRGGDEALLTPAEAAERLAVTERVLERWRSVGDGPRFAKLSRKTVRYRAADIQAFVSGSVRANTAS
jgi:hypothetical protein